MRLAGGVFEEFVRAETKLEIHQSGALMITNKSTRHRVTYSSGFWESVEETELPEPERSPRPSRR